MSLRPQWRELGDRLAREQDALLAKNPGGATLRATGRRKPRGPRWLLGAVGVLVPAGLLWAAIVLRARPLDLTVGGTPGVCGQWITASKDLAIPLRFSDRTEVTLEPEGRARVLEVTPSGAHVMLESGTVRVSVTPNRNGRWTFSAGPFTVEVRGTRFEIDWSPQEEHFELTLHEGRVMVSGCGLGDARSLLAGETLIASCRTNDFRIARGATPDALVGGPALSPSYAEASPGPPPPPADDSTATPARPSPQPGALVEDWRGLARASRFKEAFARANDKGFDGELRRADVDDLVLLGDVARLSGNSSYAVRAYQRVRDRSPRTESAANAAFSMGRVYFDQRDAYGEAARWFATYVNEQSDGPLAREALGREMEALSRAGDRAGATRAAEQYVRQYPDGPHAPLARTLRTTEAP